MLSGHFHVLLCGLNITFSASKPIANRNCVFISYTPQRLCYYNANYSKNIVLFGKCLREWLPQRLLNRKSLEFSCAVTIARLCKRAETRSLHVNTDVLVSTQFTAKDIDFLYFSSVSCQKHIKMNIEWIRMAIPVLILMPVDRYNDKPCTGAEA